MCNYCTTAPTRAPHVPAGQRRHFLPCTLVVSTRTPKTFHFEQTVLCPCLERCSCDALVRGERGMCPCGPADSRAGVRKFSGSWLDLQGGSVRVPKQRQRIHGSSLCQMPFIPSSMNCRCGQRSREWGDSTTGPLCSAVGSVSRRSVELRVWPSRAHECLTTHCNVWRRPNAESSADVFDRVTQFWDKLFEDNGKGLLTDPSVKYDMCLMVTHGLTIRLMLMCLFKWSVETFASVWNLGNCEHITLKKNAAEHKYELLGILGWLG